MGNNLVFPAEKKTTPVVFGTLLFVIALVLFYQLHDYGLVVYDEGFLFNGAHEINQGKVIYRDFFVEYPPGNFVLPALLFKNFGENVLYERIFLVLIRSMTVLFLFLLARFFVKGYAALIPPLIYLLVPGPWHKSFLPFFTVVDLYFLCVYLERAKKVKLVWLGFLTALTFLFKQEVGGFFAIAVLVSCMFTVRRGDSKSVLSAYFVAIGIYILSALLFFSPVIAYFHAKGALMDFINDCFLVSLAVRRQTESFPFPRFGFISFKAGISGFLYYTPVILSLITAFYISFSKTETYKKALLPVVIMSLLSFINIWEVPDYSHLLQSFTPTYVMGTVLADRFYMKLFPSGTSGPFWLLSKCVIVLGLLFLPVYLLMSSLFSSVSTSNYSPTPMLFFSETRRLNNAKAPVLLQDDEARTLERVVGFIDSNFKKDEAVLVVPPTYIITFLADRKNYFISDFYFSSEFMSQAQRGDLVARLAKNPPEYIITDKWRFFLPRSHPDLVYLRSFVRNYPEMYEFITHSYSIYDAIGEYVILKKGTTSASEMFYAGATDMLRQNREGALTKFKEAESCGLPEGFIEYGSLYFGSST